MGVSSCALSPFNQSANRVSAVKLQTALLSAVSCHLGAFARPSSTRILLQLFIQWQGSTHQNQFSQISMILLLPSPPPVSRLHWGFLFYSQLHHFPKNYFITMESKEFLIRFCTNDDRSSCSLKKSRVSPDWTVTSWHWVAGDYNILSLRWTPVGNQSTLFIFMM